VEGCAGRRHEMILAEQSNSRSRTAEEECIVRGARPPAQGASMPGATTAQPPLA
jgi:hypothetical protein